MSGTCGQVYIVGIAREVVCTRTSSLPSCVFVGFRTDHNGDVMDFRKKICIGQCVGPGPVVPVPGSIPVEVGYRILSSFILRKLEPAPDRKSTRLNSSHVAISYAVSCL